MMPGYSGRLFSQDKAVQIVAKDKNTGSFKVSSKAVEKLLQDDKVKDKKVCVISVAGAFRKGKSFLLNFFVKYLKTACERVHDLENWLDADKNESTGFAWRGGSERETTGIWAYNKVFILKKMEGSNIDTGQSDNSEEIAVILLDTQGTFDHNSSTNECTTIFALATLISSTLIYNLSQNIQENDLQHLQLFAEYGRKAATKATRSTTDKPFQSLMFLVRDWPNPCEYAYGLDGGRKFQKKKLAVSDKHSDLTDVRKGIKDCFNDISCCLLPYPGSTIATYNKGCKLSDANEEFRNHVKKFVEFISAYDKLIKKKIDGQEITCGNLVQFLKSYVEAFEGGRIPSATTLLRTTAIAQHLVALEHTKTQFMKDIKEECGADVPYVDPIKLNQRLDDLKTNAESTFEDYSKVRDEAINEQYLGELSNFMEETCKEYTKANRNKTNYLLVVMTKVMTFIPYILYPTSAMFEKVKCWFHRRGMQVLSFFGHIGNEISNRMPFNRNIRERIMNAIRIPLTLILIMVVFGFLSSFFGLLGLSAIAVPLLYITLVALIILCMWFSWTLIWN